MCTELLLAVIYFLTIAFVNYFLFQLLRSYWKSIIQFLQIKNIFQQYSQEKSFQKTFFIFKKEKLILPEFFSSLERKDPIFIGNLYRYLSKREEKREEKKEKNYYFYLMERQFLKK